VSELTLSEAMKLYQTVFVTMHSNISMFNLSLGLPASSESFDSVINCSTTLLSRIKHKFDLLEVYCKVKLTQETSADIHIENKRLNDGNRYWDYDKAQIIMPLCMTCKFIDFFDMRDCQQFYSYDYAEIVAIDGSIAGRSLLAKFDLLGFE
jgi:hypothetical protein